MICYKTQSNQSKLLKLLVHKRFRLMVNYCYTIFMYFKALQLAFFSISCNRKLYLLHNLPLFSFHEYVNGFPFQLYLGRSFHWHCKLAVTFQKIKPKFKVLLCIYFKFIFNSGLLKSNIFQINQRPQMTLITCPKPPVINLLEAPSH